MNRAFVCNPTCKKSFQNALALNWPSTVCCDTQTIRKYLSKHPPFASFIISICLDNPEAKAGGA